MISTVLDERRLPSLRGHLAIAHCRYSTTGSTIWENAQPTLPARAAPGARDRPQRQPRQHARAARAAPGRPGAPAGLDRHRAADRAARRRARRRTRSRRCSQVLPRVRGAYSLVVLDERRVIGVRDPYGFRPLVLGRLPRADRSAARRRRCGATTTPRPAGASSSETAAPRHRRRRVRPRRRARRDGRPRAGPGAALGPVRRGDARAVRLRAHLLRPARTRTWRAATCTRPAAGWAMQLALRAPGRRRPGHARPGHRRAGRGRLRRGVRAAVPRGDVPQPLRRPDVHPAVGRAAPAGRDDQAQPAARGRRRQAADRRRRLDRARHDDQADRRPAAQGRRDRGPRPDQRAADLPPVLLRHRHARSRPS